MKTQSINVLGYTANDSRFTVKTINADVQYNVQNAKTEAPDPFEYVLAGIAAYLNTLGRYVAAEQGMELRSLQVEITASLSLPQPEKIAYQRPFFDKIIISLKPSTTATITALQKWQSEIKRRSPLFEELTGNAPADAVLFNDYSLN
jgi:uncharacterized OsmC-like protein